MRLGSARPVHAEDCGHLVGLDLNLPSGVLIGANAAGAAWPYTDNKSHVMLPGLHCALGVRGGEVLVGLAHLIDGVFAGEF